LSTPFLRKFQNFYELFLFVNKSLFLTVLSSFSLFRGVFSTRKASRFVIFRLAF